MLNTALILHLLTQVQHLVHGRHFHTFVWTGCFETVRHVDPQSHKAYVRLVCGFIKVAQRAIVMKWS